MAWTRKPKIGAGHWQRPAALSLTLAALLIATAPARATLVPVPVGNPSFEEVYTDASKDTPYTFASGHFTPGLHDTFDNSFGPNLPIYVPDWYFETGVNNNNDAGLYSTSIPGMTGPIHLSIGHDNITITQTLSSVFSPGSYTLSAKLAGNGQPNSAFRLELLAGTTLLTAFSVTEPGMPTWPGSTTWTREYSGSDPAYAGLLGQPLTIRLGRATGNSGVNLYFDNVQLDFERIPEPSTLLLLGAGGWMLWSRCHRRRRA